MKSPSGKTRKETSSKALIKKQLWKHGPEFPLQSTDDYWTVRADIPDTIDDFSEERKHVTFSSNMLPSESVNVEPMRNILDSTSKRYKKKFRLEVSLKPWKILKPTRRFELLRHFVAFDRRRIGHPIVVCFDSGTSLGGARRSSQTELSLTAKHCGLKPSGFNGTGACRKNPNNYYIFFSPAVCFS